MKIPHLVSVVAALLLVAVPAQSRTWTSSDGRTIEAELVQWKDGKVTLKRTADNRIVTLKLDALSELDQAYLLEQASKPAPTAELKPVVAKDMFADRVTGEWEKLEHRRLKFRFYGGKELDGAKTYPLVIFLHGRGSGGTDNEKQLGAGPRSFAEPSNYGDRPCFILAPQCPDDSIGWNGAVQDDLFKLIELSLKSLPIDRKRVYLTGLSMGGYGTWAAIAREPDLFAAAIPVCGGGDPASARDLRKLPIWAFHGEDDDVVPAEQSRRMVEALEKARAKIKYTELPGVRHNAWDYVYPKAEVHEWLFQQSR
jgi:predicted peptidase